MADKIYVKIDPVSGDFSESTGINTSAGSADGNKLIATTSAGTIDVTLLPPGIGADTKMITAFETVAAGDYINIFDDSGTKKVRKAVASSDKRAHGFALSAATAGNPVTVYFDGSNNALTGIVPGTQYFLSDTVAGSFTITPVTGTGKIHQSLGYGTTTTSISTELGAVVFKA